MRHRGFGEKAIVRGRKTGFRPKPDRRHLQSPEKPEKKPSKRREEAKSLSPRMLEVLKPLEKEFIERYNQGDSIASIYRHFYENRGFTASENTLGVFTEWLVSKRKIKRRKKRLRGRTPGTGLREETHFKLDPHQEYIKAALKRGESRSTLAHNLARRGANVSDRTLESYIAWLKKAK